MNYGKEKKCIQNSCHQHDHCALTRLSHTFSLSRIHTKKMHWPARLCGITFTDCTFAFSTNAVQSSDVRMSDKRKCGKNSVCVLCNGDDGSCIWDCYYVWALSAVSNIQHSRSACRQSGRGKKRKRLWWSSTTLHIHIFIFVDFFLLHFFPLFCFRSLSLDSVDLSLSPVHRVRHIFSVCLSVPFPFVQTFAFLNSHTKGKNVRKTFGITLHCERRNDIKSTTKTRNFCLLFAVAAAAAVCVRFEIRPHVVA